MEMDSFSSSAKVNELLLLPLKFCLLFCSSLSLVDATREGSGIAGGVRVNIDLRDEGGRRRIVIGDDLVGDDGVITVLMLPNVLVPWGLSDGDETAAE